MLAVRRAAPSLFTNDVAAFLVVDSGVARLELGPSPLGTLRSTARLRLPNGQFSDVQRSVAALVAFISLQVSPPYHILRWFDNAYSTR